VVTREQRRTIVDSVLATAESERRACRWLGFHRSAVRYIPDRREEQTLRDLLRDLADKNPRWGAPMLIWKLRQQGVRDNHKRIRRLYRLEVLAVRRQRRKRVAVPRVVAPAATQANEQWAMDFMRDTLADGRAFRALTLIDTCTRESPVIEVDVSLGAVRVVAVLERLRATRGLPQRITVDNGPEFQSKALDAWAHHNHVKLVFSRPGKPVDNTFIEAFNGRVRDECLNQHWFLSLADARRTIERWRESYNTAQPHSALGGRTPSEYATALLALAAPT
jgi:putative transposase